MASAKFPNYQIRYESLLALTHDAVCLVDPDGKIIHGNRRAAALLGCTPRQLIGAAAKDFLAAEEHEASDRRLAAVFGGSKIPLYRRRFVRRDGSTFTAEMDIAAVHDEHGQPSCLAAVIRDVSERQGEQEALRLIVEGTSTKTGEHFFDSVVEQLAAVLCMDHALVSECFDPSAGRVRSLAFWSRGRLMDNFEFNLVGTPCENVLDGRVCCYESNIQELFPEDEDLKTLGAQSYLAVPMRNAGNETIGHLAVLGNKPMYALQRSESIVQIFGARAGAELERLQAGRALHESEARFRLVVEQIPAVTFIEHAGERRHVRYVSPQVEQLLGYPASAWTEGDGVWRKALHVDDRERVIQSYELSRERREPFIDEYRLNAKDGKVVWVRSETFWVRDENEQPLFQLGTVQDITDRRRREEELFKARNLESVGILAGGIAHDFNNLLMGIMGSLSLAQADLDPDSRAYKRIRDADKVTRRTASLAKQLLSLSKGGAPVRRTTALSDQIRDSVEFVLSGSNVQAEFDLPEDLHNVDADIEQISHVVENVVINAMQAMPDGGTIRLRAENVDLPAGNSPRIQPGGYIRITISDEGCGIDPEDLGKIFDPYFTRKAEGSGLGLATSHAVIHRHEGLIRVESEPGLGSSFSIFLPTSDRPLPAEPVDDHACLSFRSRILLMDDEEIVQSVAKGMLERLGCETMVASNGAEAIELFEQARSDGRPIDIVILDLTVPGGLGGKQTIQRLLAIDPRVRAIVSSGYSDDQVMSHYAEHGFDSCLVKPYGISDLHAALTRAAGSVRH